MTAFGLTAGEMPSPQALLRKSALLVLYRCRRRELDVNHPDAIEAAKIVGRKQALDIVLDRVRPARKPWADAMLRRVPGSIATGRRR
jgi:hypothetical protein